jgi:hypothetical protein
MQMLNVIVGQLVELLAKLLKELLVGPFEELLDESLGKLLIEHVA